MEASTLRWILIVVGLFILGLILVFGNPGKKKKPRASRKDRVREQGKDRRRSSDRPMRTGKKGERVRKEPTLGPVSDTEARQDGEAFEPGDQGELPIEEEKPRKEPTIRKGPPPPAPDKIVTLYLIARDNHVITGAQLLEAAVKTGMDFGQMDIFHRVSEADSQSVFSLANAAKPGNFDRGAWPEFETRALVLFMTLPNPRQALDAWDAMLAAANRMAGILNAEVHDEEHHPFSRRKEARIREEMREYDRKQIAKRS